MVTEEMDLLPQDIHWRDEGCELFASCLSCPRPRCIEEEPRGKQRLRMRARAGRMAELQRQGKSAEEIASFYGVSKRTVQRAIASQRVKIKMQDARGERQQA